MQYDITPNTKPRMTQRDRWLNPPRPCVQRYRNFADRVISKGVKLNNSGFHITFKMPMPKSWSKKKRAEMLGGPHTQVPDIDNLLKALLDALYKNDSHIWDIRATKLWSNKGAILVVEEA